MGSILIFICALALLGYPFSTFARTQMQAMQLAFFFLPSILLWGFMLPARPARGARRHAAGRERGRRRPRERLARRVSAALRRHRPSSLPLRAGLRFCTTLSTKPSARSRT
jgi:hypothetical protein